MTQEYNNPTPVAVLLVPVVEQKKIELFEGVHTINVTRVLGLVRGIEPRIGQTALPGGFVDEKENIEMGAVRELDEETGLPMSVEDIKLYKSEITPGNQVLVFCTTPEFSPEVLHLVEANLEVNEKMKSEVRGFKIVNAQDALAFPLHEKVTRKFLNEENLKNISHLGANMEGAFAQLKAQGYFSEDFELKNKKRMAVSV